MKNSRYIKVLIRVTIAPTFRNSVNAIVIPILLSKTSRIMIFDATPRIVKLPAIVELIAKANQESTSI
jgi:hypothetical protein